MTEHPPAELLRHPLATFCKSNRFSLQSPSHQTAGHPILERPDNPGGDTFDHRCRVGGRDHNCIVVDSSHTVQARRRSRST
ncbi:MAG: hypothetical protein BWY17_05323 [Deltaproteobacteria bacterium ADurb.Bin207]|nr:MAG: hypothetical protein BWY17_05323 [Deltaproteobacteria bacterium ADurb.Bin207]